MLRPILIVDADKLGSHSGAKFYLQTSAELYFCRRSSQLKFCHAKASSESLTLDEPGGIRGVETKPWSYFPFCGLLFI
jgi:hypothetical protein